jgi:hypothetical protein
MGSVKSTTLGVLLAAAIGLASPAQAGLVDSMWVEEGDAPGFPLFQRIEGPVGGEPVTEIRGNLGDGDVEDTYRYRHPGGSFKAFFSGDVEEGFKPLLELRDSIGFFIQQSPFSLFVEQEIRAQDVFLTVKLVDEKDPPYSIILITPGQALAPAAAVPEPGSLVLLAAGLTGLLALRRRLAA